MIPRIWVLEPQHTEDSGFKGPSPELFALIHKLSRWNLSPFSMFHHENWKYLTKIELLEIRYPPTDDLMALFAALNHLKLLKMLDFAVTIKDLGEFLDSFALPTNLESVSLKLEIKLNDQIALRTDSINKFSESWEHLNKITLIRFEVQHRWKTLDFPYLLLKSLMMNSSPVEFHFRYLCLCSEKTALDFYEFLEQGSADFFSQLRKLCIESREICMSKPLALHTRAVSLKELLIDGVSRGFQNYASLSFLGNVVMSLPRFHIEDLQSLEDLLNWCKDLSKYLKGIKLRFKASERSQMISIIGKFAKGVISPYPDLDIAGIFYNDPELLGIADFCEKKFEILHRPRAPDNILMKFLL